MAPHSYSQAPVEQLNLRALRLRPGMALQARRAVNGSMVVIEGQFMAAIEGKGVMVGPHGDGVSVMTMRPGEEYELGGFTGQYDFSFTAKVIQLFQDPFVYALLAYPAAVQARKVRQAVRMRTSLPAQVAGATGQIEGMLVDLSTAGAMFQAPSTVGSVNEPVVVGFNANVDGSPVAVKLQATVCHSGKSDAPPGVNVGLAFRALTANDKLVLSYLTRAAE